VCGKPDEIRAFAALPAVGLFRRCVSNRSSLRLTCNHSCSCFSSLALALVGCPVKRAQAFAPLLLCWGISQAVQD